MNTFLEILKITLPALIVFLTIYLIMKNYLKQQYQLQTLSMRQKNTQHAIPLKLQAYERLTMLCERISIPNLILRLRTNDMTAQELTNSMILAVQQEYEHNLTQQVYISDELWNILTLAKNNVLAEITEFSGSITPNMGVSQLIEVLSNAEIQSASSMIHAKKAIKKELQMHMV